MGEIADYHLEVMQEQAWQADWSKEEQMSEKTTNAKTQQIEVKKVYRNEKGPWALVVTDLETGNEEKLRFWPTLKGKNGSYNNPAQSAEEGGRYLVSLFYQDGRAGYEGEWMVKKCEPLATRQDAQEVFGKTSDGSKPAPVVTDRDKSIMYQSARKDAAVIEAAFITSMGHDAWLKERGWAAFKATTEDCYRMVIDLANSGFDPFSQD